MSEEKKLSPVEVFKQESQHLKGEIPEELVDGNDYFGKGSIQLLKHHGLYQQDNRDVRGAKSETGAKAGKSYSFMIRTKIPGGKLTSDQLLAELDLCDEVGNTTLRITTRQGLQLHGVLKDDIQKTMRRLDEVQLSCLAACGDVCRNFMCVPVPYKGDSVHQDLQRLSDQLAERFCPQTSAYYEIWLKDTETGEKELVAGGSKDDEPVEPIYGKTYLPRKFKMAIGLPGDNSVDVYAQDIGFMAVCEEFKVVGYNLIVGGGFGVTPTAAKTFKAIGAPLCYVTAEQAIDVAEAIVKVQRDFGNRADRKVARLKYTIADIGGMPAFKAKVEEYYGGPIADPKPLEPTGFHDGMGWHDQGDGKLFYGLDVENGRVKDEGDFRLKSALREICTTLKPGIRLTAHQSIIFTDIDPADKEKLEQIITSHGVKLTEDVSVVRRYAMACPALPTCGLSITESERALPGMIDQLEVELQKLGLQDEIFTTRMTGCPNGCARPYNSDIGLVGKAKDKYTILLGGRTLGNRLNWIFKDLVHHDDVISTLVPVFVYFKEDRHEGETFGDFCERKGQEDLLAWCDQHATGAAS